MTKHGSICYREFRALPGQTLPVLGLQLRLPDVPLGAISPPQAVLVLQLPDIPLGAISPPQAVLVLQLPDVPRFNLTTSGSPRPPAS